ncbi:TIM barrel protein [Frankia sp. AgB1.9]|uniref:sugar phosphate isomerase/epimerase family protein n=1 Tax=unclassified Frankia TaxID=2632575 RepID=UPI0019342073|nr:MULTISPECIES: TIM barrel protein [unclassified Frankia]MBL7492616.1 TIM barrel protein [Frankia sp. AgW1.1]MBL7549319.1 TIM barrel protein [Frankia sp. AgB1.9]MBL7619214.1 TIM barrel protein [Frankia sp. AgB1.8]
MTRVGADSSKFPRSLELGAIGTLKAMKAAGLEGAFFRSPFELSRTMDPAELSDVVQAAAALDMYIETGIAKVNPYATPEAPEIREFGRGSYFDGMARIIEAVADVGITELWTATANYKHRLPGLFACDRFRTDVDWEDQLAATEKYLTKLGPVLRGAGAHLNIETHEEITSFETIRLVEAGGPDAFGITFDIANVVCRGEEPSAAARRLAPYVRQTHFRDVALVETDDGYGRFIVPIGSGIIDWPVVLGLLAEHNPNLNISIEGITATRAEMSLFLHEPRWAASHRDLTADEFAALERRAAAYGAEVAAGRRPGPDDLRADVSEQQELDFFTTSAAALRDVITAAA